MEVTLLRCTPDCEKIIEEAYLSCKKPYYKITNTGNSKKRFKTIFIKKHFSVLEHASATFLLQGISRSCSHQIVRHRIASYSQISLRSVNANEFVFITPPSISKNRDILDIYSKFIDESIKTYNKLLKKGIPKEDARFCIPMSIETQLIVTMNFRSLIHFLKLRNSSEAQWEIKAIADKILEIMIIQAPNIFTEENKKYWE